MNKKIKKILEKAPESVLQSKIVVICSCGKKIEHAHYATKKDEKINQGVTGHGEPLSFPKVHTSKTFKK